MGADVDRSLPSGEVTLLFSDIEGSTRLASELGDRYGDVLDAHQRLLREVWSEHGGVEVGTEGDSFFVAFADARDAIDAADRALRTLAGFELPHRARLHVRIGLHTGSPRIRNGDYWGIDVHRASRVMGVAYGGQVLLSDDTRRAAGGGYELLDLGHHWLKDLPAPERLFQLVAAELPSEFPPLQSLNRSNVPAETRPLIGRERELALVRRLLTETGSRLLTLTGVAGTGKTRLATSAASLVLPSFPGGVFFVGLADLDDPRQVLGAIAEAAQVADVPDQSLARTLAEAFSGAPTLLLLDNFERLLAAASDIGVLLAATPNLRVLATSQVPLRISAERLVPLGPLSPEEGVALFVDRASALIGDYEPGHDTEVLTELCERLDGLPLAIELAAARARVLGPRDLLARIGQRLDLLRDSASDRPGRHRSLRAAIESSYELLPAADRSLFTRLAQFVAPFSVEAAQALCGPDALDGLERLVDHSFVRRLDLDGTARFTVAQALRAFAFAELDRAGELEAWRRCHAQWALSVAEAYWRVEYTLPGNPSASLTEVYEDVRAALWWAQEHDRASYLRLAGALGPFWDSRGLASEGREHLRRALADVDLFDVAAARALLADAVLAASAGEVDESLVRADATITAARQAHDPACEVLALTTRSEILLSLGRHAEARSAAAEAVELSKRCVPELVDRSVLYLANAEIADGEIAGAEQMLADRIAAGSPRRDITRVYLTHLHADCALQRGQHEAAARRYAEAASLASELGALIQTAFDFQGLAMSLGGQGRAADALEADAMAQKLIDELEFRETAEWWEALRAKHLDPARETLSTSAAADARATGAQCPAGERVARARELAGINTAAVAS